MRRSFITALLASSLLSIGLCAHAQSVGSTPAPVQYILAPENPEPNQLVDITVQGVGGFLGNSDIIWQVNGVTKLEGVGAHEFTFTTATLGKPTVVSVTIQSQAYGTITKQWSFNPSRIDLIWEAGTSVPPFYGGKPLPSAGSEIRVIAFPEVMKGGSAVSSASLSYQWKLDDSAMPDQSGLGQSSFTFSADQLHQNADVSVDVSLNGVVVGHNDIVIPFSQPLIALYVHDPLRGVLYNRALVGSYTLPSVEETLRAEPYYFSADSLTQGLLSFSWQLNGNDTTGPNTAQGELTVRQTGTGAGQAALSVSIQNNDSSKLLQAAQTFLPIIFGSGTNSAPGASNPFGL